LSKPRYRIAVDDVKEIVIKPNNPNNKAPFRARILHGSDSSIMIAERGSGYHTEPHKHDCEQINYIMSGEMWFFVEKDAYRCLPGDVMRIPPNAVHWAWNRGSEPVTILECHAPRVTADNQHNDRIASLLGPQEDSSKMKTVTNVYVPYVQAEIDEIEKKAIAAEMAAGR